MNLEIERRAEIALRSLQNSDKKKIERAFETLLSSDRTALYQNPKLHKLASSFSDRKFFVYDTSPKLSLVLSFAEDVYIVEDIIAHDRLEQLIELEAQK